MKILHFIIRYMLGSKRMRRYRRGLLARSFRKLRRRIRIRRVIKHAVSLAATAAAWGLAISGYEKNHPVYARYRQDSHGKLKEPVRFVFLTDLHEKEFGRNNKKLLHMIDKVSPDAVLIGGDMPTAPGHNGRITAKEKGGKAALLPEQPEKQKHWIYRLLQRRCRSDVSLALCRELAGRYPVYYGIGNHELRMPEEYMAEAAGMGVHILDDSAEEFKGVRLAGYTVPGECYTRFTYDRPDEDRIRELTRPQGSQEYTVLLAHSPNFMDEYAGAGVDLVLSGHFHGGTIRIGHMGLMTPQYQLFNRNCHGRKHKDGTDMIVSAGLGTHTVNIRINDRPEVVVVDIH